MSTAASNIANTHPKHKEPTMNAEAPTTSTETIWFGEVTVDGTRWDVWIIGSSIVNNRAWLEVEADCQEVQSRISMTFDALNWTLADLCSTIKGSAA